MKLNEFEVKAAAVGRPVVAPAVLTDAAEAGKGESSARALAELLKWMCCRCMEIGWTFEEVAQMALEGQGDE